jgi:hypothetical protein
MQLTAMSGAQRGLEHSPAETLSPRFQIGAIAGLVQPWPQNRSATQELDLDDGQIEYVPQSDLSWFLRDLVCPLDLCAFSSFLLCCHLPASVHSLTDCYLFAQVACTSPRLASFGTPLFRQLFADNKTLIPIHFFLWSTTSLEEC